MQTLKKNHIIAVNNTHGFDDHIAFADRILY